MTPEERLAVLETEMSSVQGDIKEIKESLSILIAGMNKSRGFWGGVVFAATALGALIQYLLIQLFSARP